MNPFEAYYRQTVQQAASRQYEDLLLSQILAEGLKAPVREYRFHEQRKWRFDFAYLDERIAVEVEGGIWTDGRHTRGYGFESDCEKYNEAALSGWKVLRVSPKMVKDLSALSFIKRALNDQIRN